MCEGQNSTDMTTHSALTVIENPQELGAGRDRQGIGAWLTRVKQWVFLESVCSMQEAGGCLLETLKAMNSGAMGM